MSLSELDNQSQPKYDESFRQNERKMTFFKRIGHFFGKSLTVSSPTKTQSVKKLNEQVDTFLNNNMMSLVHDLMLSGYELTKKQAKRLDEMMISELKRDANRFLNSLIRKNYPIDEKFLLQYCFTDAFSNFVHHHINKTSSGEEQTHSKMQPVHYLIATKLEDREFCRKLFDIWFQTICSCAERSEFLYPTSKYLFKHEVKNAFEAFKRYSPTLIFQDVELKEYMKVIEILYIMPVSNPKKESTAYCVDPNDRNLLMESLQKGISQNLSQQINDLKQHTQNVFSEELLEKQTKAQSIKLVQDLNLKELPEEAKRLIQGFKTQLPLVHVQELSVTQQQDFENLTTKRLPEILQKYFSIHQDYRNTLRDNDGKTPENLMLDALQTISQVVSQIIEQQQEEKVKDLSVAKKMTQHYRNRF